MSQTAPLTSGKLYLPARTKAHNVTDTAIVRLQQIYPVPRRKLGHLRTLTVTHFRWAGGGAGKPRFLDEPPGAGPAGDPRPRLKGIKRCSRRAMAAPSAGSARVHEVEQAAVIAAAFAHERSADRGILPANGRLGR